MRLKTAVLTAVIAGSLAGPSVIEASAATRSHSVAASRAAVRRRAASATRTRALRTELKKLQSIAADDSTAGPDPVGVVESVISEIKFDLSGGNIQAILWDLPGFGPY